MEKQIRNTHTSHMLQMLWNPRTATETRTDGHWTLPSHDDLFLMRNWNEIAWRDRARGPLFWRTVTAEWTCATESCTTSTNCWRSHRSCRKVTLFLWHVRQVLIKWLATTLPHLPQCELDMTRHFSKFVLRNTETFTWAACNFTDSPLFTIKWSNLILISWKGFLPRCHFLAFLSYMFWGHKNILYERRLPLY